MKYELEKKQTIAARRTLKSLLHTLVAMLEQQPFEKISVQTLCEQAMVPRATFYNYFEDKYDLLNYVWLQLQLQLDPKYSHCQMEYETYVNLVFDNMIDFLTKRLERCQKICKINANSVFFTHLHDYLAAQILAKVRTASEAGEQFHLPLELVATVYANSVIIVGKWWLTHESECTPQQVHQYFRILIDQVHVHTPDAAF